jgi:hypothetical protein
MGKGRREQKNNSGGAFQVLTTSQSIQIDCYGTEGKTMDLLVILWKNISVLI